MKAVHVICTVLLVSLLAFVLSACVSKRGPSEQSLRMIKDDIRVYANRVVESQRTDNGSPQRVLGAPDFTRAGVFTLGDGYVVVDMGEGEEVVDGQGDDLRVWESDTEYYAHFAGDGRENELYEVRVSTDLAQWVSLGRKRGTSSFDLGRVGVNSARYVMIVGDIEGMGYKRAPGPDIDAVEALHMVGMVAPVASPSTAVAQVATAPLATVGTDNVAVIIGNRNYSQRNKDVPDVDFAHNDFELVRELVLNKLRYREGNVIPLKDATQADLINVFGTEREYRGQLYDWIKPGVSEVFIYYSGHGAPSLADGKGYLLPIDANPNRVELNGYSLETLYANLARLNAKRITVVIDACFSGGAHSGTIVRNASSISLKRVAGPEINSDRMVLLTAAGAGEVASWDTEAGNSLFTRLFIKGINGEADRSGGGDHDGRVTLSELKSYLVNEVGYFARRTYSREQHPEVYGDPKTILLP